VHFQRQLQETEIVACPRENWQRYLPAPHDCLDLHPEIPFHTQHVLRNPKIYLRRVSQKDLEKRLIIDCLAGYTWRTIY
jgi:hypothetical protein